MAAPAEKTSPRSDCVFVLHGLARSPRSMEPLATRLEASGFAVENLGYASTKEPFERFVASLSGAVEAKEKSCERIHFVGYSLGALIVRSYLHEARPARLGRVVLIAPPNGGSEIVDAIGDTRLFRGVFGPVATRLGTGEASLPRKLPPPDYPIGVVAGNWPINPLGWLFLPEPHDGTVSVASTRLEGMSDFVVVRRSHTFIAAAPEVADDTIRFLRTGRFRQSSSTESTRFR